MATLSWSEESHDPVHMATMRRLVRRFLMQGPLPADVVVAHILKMRGLRGHDPRKLEAQARLAINQTLAEGDVQVLMKLTKRGEETERGEQ